MRPKDISMVAVIILIWAGIGYFVYIKYFAEKKTTNTTEQASSSTNELSNLEITEEVKNKINGFDAHGEFPIKVEGKGTENPFKAN